jgi:hypothetical protein
MFLAQIDPSLHPSERIVSSSIAFGVLYHAIATKFIGRSDMGIGAGAALGPKSGPIGGVGGLPPRAREGPIPNGEGSSSARDP